MELVLKHITNRKLVDVVIVVLDDVERNMVPVGIDILSCNTE